MDVEIVVPRRPFRCGYSTLVQPRHGDVAIVQLGRYGDIINMLPIALHVSSTYRKPYIVVSKEFNDVLDDVPYAIPFVLDLAYDKLPEAVAFARSKFSHVITTQIWGTNWKQERMTGAYNLESWRAAGMLPQFYDQSLLPIFDFQDSSALEMAASLRKTQKPLIVTCLTSGHSSPFHRGKVLLDGIKKQWGERCEIVETGGLKLEKIQHLLGLLRQANLIISADTAVLHLAACTSAALIALVNPAPWAGTLPRIPAQVFNYSVVNLDMLNKAISQAICDLRIPTPPWEPVQDRRIFHVVPINDSVPKEDNPRRAIAARSWERLYQGGVIPIHTRTEQSRFMTHFGSSGRLPFLHDILGQAMDAAGDDDIIAYTNDDIICHPDLPNKLQFHCSVYGCVAERRCELSPDLPPPSLNDRPGRWVDLASAAKIEHLGRDLYAFTKRWLVRAMEELPDFVVGATDWDNCLIGIMRRHFGYDLDLPGLEKMVWPCEMEVGWTAHIYHKPLWKSFGNFHHSTANVHNRKLFRGWAENHAPLLKFNEDNHLIP